MLHHPSAYLATGSSSTVDIRSALTLTAPHTVTNKVDKIDFWLSLRLLRALPTEVTVGISDRLGAALLTFVR